jgi:hypothetical protein
MKTLFLVSIVAALASACAIRTETVERPVATTAYVTPVPTSTVVYY